MAVGQTAEFGTPRVFQPATRVSRSICAIVCMKSSLSRPRSDPYTPAVGRRPVRRGCPASHLLLGHPGHTASDGSFYRDFAQPWRKDAGARRIQVGLRRNSRNKRLDGRRWPGRIGIEVRIVGHSSEMGNRYEARSCILPFFRFSSSLSLLLELPRFPGDLFVQHHAETRR